MVKAQPVMMKKGAQYPSNKPKKGNAAYTAVSSVTLGSKSSSAGGFSNCGVRLPLGGARGLAWVESGRKEINVRFTFPLKVLG